MLIEVSNEDAMPRFRAVLARAGQTTLVSEADPKIKAIAREEYARMCAAARPFAASVDVAREDFPAEIPEQIDGCPIYTLFFFSLGEAADAATNEMMSAGETMRGLFRDAWGSEGVDALADRVDAKYRARRGEGTMRFAPGYSGYDIRNNALWFERIFRGSSRDDREGEFKVFERTGLISPRKSIICAIGWRNGGMDI